MNNEILARAKEAKRALEGGFICGAAMLVDTIIELAKKEQAREEARRIEMLRRVEAIAQDPPQFLQKHAD